MVPDTVVIGLENITWDVVEKGWLTKRIEVKRYVGIRRSSGLYRRRSKRFWPIVLLSRYIPWPEDRHRFQKIGLSRINNAGGDLPESQVMVAFVQCAFSCRLGTPSWNIRVGDLISTSARRLG